MIGQREDISRRDEYGEVPITEEDVAGSEVNMLEEAGRFRGKSPTPNRFFRVSRLDRQASQDFFELNTNQPSEPIPEVCDWRRPGLTARRRALSHPASPATHRFRGMGDANDEDLDLLDLFCDDKPARPLLSKPPSRHQPKQPSDVGHWKQVATCGW